MMSTTVSGRPGPSGACWLVRFHQWRGPASPSYGLVLVLLMVTYRRIATGLFVLAGIAAVANLLAEDDPSGYRLLGAVRASRFFGAEQAVQEAFSDDRSRNAPRSEPEEA